MKKQRLLGLVLVLALLATVGEMTGAAMPIGASTLSDIPSGAAEAPPVDSQTQEAIVIDHTCTDLSQIPAYWLEQAKELTIHYAHTSHGSQINSGLDKLDEVDPTYNVDVFYAGSAPPTSLACEHGALCMYDGNPPETYIRPEDYWETSGGISRTTAVADTGLFDFSMWSWCGQQSYYSEAQVQQYLDTMSDLEVQYPDMRFILMTGHTDGGSSTLERNNNMVRQYAVDNDMVLFDFADIETYDPLGGGPHVNNSDGTCTWCVDFCSDHPAYCTDLPGSCAHSRTHPEDALFCKLKGNAFWWMMARLAGWEGQAAEQPDLASSYKAVSSSRADHDERITYTVAIRNDGTPFSDTVYLTDTVPTDLNYIPGTLTATLGTPDESAAPILRWSGALFDAPAVAVTYATTVSLPGGTDQAQFVRNVAIISAETTGFITRTATLIANGYAVYLPMVLREA